MELQSLKGFHDILPEEVGYWQDMEHISRKLLESYGFRELRLPILEYAALFKKGIGEGTDIVSKEMYSFSDQKGRELCLRPEATSQVVRSYIQNRMDLKEPISKLYLIGPMFRHERPQKGRFRQFHQIDVELIGDPGPISDAEILILAWNLLGAFKLEGLELVLNSLGCEICRPPFKTQLIQYLRERLDSLCLDCQRRLETNPLRVFDCKQDTCKASLKDAPLIGDFWCDECKRHLDKVTFYLTRASVPFRLDPTLVRGLDYYTRTAFEIKSKALGAQDAVAGGGRYDKLISQLGGPERPAIGFAIGMERVVEILRSINAPIKKNFRIFLVALGDQAREEAFFLMQDLREEGFLAEMAYQDASLKSQLRHASKLKADIVLIIGDEELRAGFVTLKDMNTGKQSRITGPEIKTTIEELQKQRDGNTEWK